MSIGIKRDYFYSKQLLSDWRILTLTLFKSNCSLTAKSILNYHVLSIFIKYEFVDNLYN